MTLNDEDRPEGIDDGGPSLEDPRLFEVLEDYQRELESGRAPNRAAYVNRYPELAATVESCLEGLELVHGGMGSASHAAAADARRAGQGQLAKPLGDFQIVRELARGGMGVVYEAIQLSLGRRVALKVLPFAATFDARQLQRFKNEAQAAALLHHTHIVPIHAVGCERGVHFYAMQLIEGQSLAVVIEQLRQKEGKEPKNRPRSRAATTDSTIDRAPGTPPAPLEAPSPGGADMHSTLDVSATITGGGSRCREAYVRRVAGLIVQAAEALEHAHQEGVIHRDIKPANLLVDATGKLWITDFGLAQLQVDNGLTRSGDLVGTFRYMSPEQTSGQRTMLDHRTDIYSLGATFYELLTLEPVFPGETHQELLYQILHTEPRSLRDANRTIPIELETIVLKALSKSPADRYRTAAELAADIQRYLDHQPILARRPSLVDRVRKWSRRHPSVVVATVVLLMVVAAISLASYRRIAAEQRLTAEALDREMLRAQEAEERFQQARQAVDAVFRVSEEELADRPFDTARRRILEIVLSHYQEFIEQRQGDPAAQAELARVRERVKEILSELDLMHRDVRASLLEHAPVQQELKLSAEQAAQVKTLMQTWRVEREPLFQRGTDLSDEQRRTRLVTLARQHETAMAGILTDAQQRRIDQLWLQLLGVAAFKEPSVVESLGLTAEQRSQIRAIERTLFPMFGPSSPRPGHGPGDFRGPPPGEPFGPGRRRPPPDFATDGPNPTAAMQQVLAVLTPLQAEEWQELIGEPYTGDFPRFGPPPREPRN